MIFTPRLAQIAQDLARIPDDELMLYPPVERAVIMTVKQLMKTEKDCPIAVGLQDEHDHHQMG